MYAPRSMRAWSAFDAIAPELAGLTARASAPENIVSVTTPTAASIRSRLISIS
jgi:hypothetical protein